MRIALLTNEYPPHVYGGAGVHVDFLSRELARLEGAQHEVQILCFGDQDGSSDGLRVRGVDSTLCFEVQDPRHEKLLDTLHKNLIMAGMLKRADIVHCHTWYTLLAGCLLKQLHGAPLVLTTHSLEPHRPWKEEQLGSGYRATTWLEKTAYQNADGVIAVSESMKRDVNRLYGVPLEKVEVIHNGIDLDQYRPSPDPEILNGCGIDPDLPFVLFVGRVTRQKGIIHFVNALKDLKPGVQAVLCAGAPDTKAVEEEMEQRVSQARKETGNRILWIREFVPRREIIALYTHAAIFVCPSVYEPFGIINLEAMACETPVVASAVGGIPEVVVDGETGVLIPFKPVSETDFEPADPKRFSSDLISAVNALLDSPERLRSMGIEARRRVEQHFSWRSIAERTLGFYRKLLRP